MFFAAARLADNWILPPFGHDISPHGEVWDACAAGDFAYPPRLIKFSALRALGFASRRRLCASTALYFVLRQELIGFAALRALGSASRRSLGRLRGARQGGAGYGATPPSRPPLHPPRSTPLKFSASAKRRGQRVFAAGASFPRSARSGDLPPRRVNARVRSRFDQYPLQPTPLSTLTNYKACFVPISTSNGHAYQHPAWTSQRTQ